MGTDEKFMKEAVAEAQKAAEMNEVPVGAVAVVDDRIIERAHNIRESTGNPLGHAEILLLEKIVADLGDWRFEDVTIYVTCEPCIMCIGAMLQARIKRVVFGCYDPKAGACGTLYNLAQVKRLNHQIELTGGVLSKECGRLLSDFFKKLRQ